MKEDDLFTLVCQSLPKDIPPHELRKFGKEEWWKINKYLAIIYAIRKHPKINWEAYIERNQDVKELNIDPVLHFMKHGIFEGRKLYSYNDLEICAHASRKSSPKVSIIISNYNNEVYLEKCLRSAISQTLDDIEIIIIDDGSTDSSVAILKNFEAMDSRIKLILFDMNQSLHMTRKAGVNAANGKYIIFLDADDFLLPTACEKAYEQAVKGYDLVGYGSKLINHKGLTPNELARTDNWYNGLPAGEYPGKELIKMVFIEKRLRQTMWGKIWLAAILKQAFSEMEDGYYTRGEDAYEFLVIATKIRNFYMLSERLYCYSIGVSISALDLTSEKVTRFAGIGQLWPVIERYTKELPLKKYQESIKSILIDSSLFLLPDLQRQSAQPYLQLLSMQYGIDDVVVRLMENNFYDWDKIAAKLQTPQYLSNNKDNNIGIFYHRLSLGGVEQSINNICNILLNLDYNVILFIEETSDINISIDARVKTIFIPHSIYDKNYARAHISGFYKALISNRIGLLIHMNPFSPFLLWETILLHLLEIPIIGSVRLDHTHELLASRRSERHASLPLVLKCLDKVTCLNLSTEIYLRSEGVDAKYIPNSIGKVDLNSDFQYSTHKILFMARMDEPLKRIKSALAILAEVIKQIPDAQMIVVGDFIDVSKKKDFYASVNSLGLNNNVELIGWTQEPAKYIEKCDLLLSTSYLEGFPNAIAEAQANGLPVVMYELDIELAKDNTSIIQIAQGDIEAAACAIVKLLSNNKLSSEIAQEAIAATRKYSTSRLSADIHDLITTFHIKSDISIYSPKDYQNAIRHMTFYAGRPIPNP